MVQGDNATEPYAEGAPLGVDPAVVEAAYAAVKRADPYHPVAISLNCAESAPFYGRA